MNTALILFAWNLGLLFPIALAAWCLCRIPFFKRRPALCHGVWLLVLLKFLTPPLIAVPVLPTLASPEIHEPAPARSQTESDSFKTEMKSTAAPSGLSRFDDSGVPDVALPHPDEQTEPRAEPSFLATIRPWQWALFCLFVLSGVITLILWAAAWRQLTGIRRLLRSGLDGSDSCAPLLAEIARRFRLKTVPKICQIESEVSPMLWAEPRRPVILLPRTLIEKLGREELQLVLAHELAHYLRRDHWFNLFAFLVTSLFWWHPVAWFARREMVQAAESGCDALVLDRFTGSRKSYAQTLLKVVDFIATQSSAQTTWTSQFGGASPLGRRMEMIASSAVRASVSRSGWSLLLVVALAFSLLPVRGRDELKASAVGSTLANPAVDPSTPSASGRFFVQGSVIEKDTGQPIGNASLNFFVDGEKDEKKRRLTTFTDAAGRFRLEVPVGLVQLWDPALKPGYWLPFDESTVSLTTSFEEPVATIEIKARRGGIWPIQIKTDQPMVEHTSLLAVLNEEEDDLRRAKFLNGEDPGNSTSVPSPSSHALFDRDGKGFLTQCGTSGKFYLAVGDLNFTTDRMIPTLQPVTAELIAEPHFDPSKVKTIHSIAGTEQVELIDQSGKKARIGKAKVDLDVGQARLTFHLKQIEKNERNEKGPQDFLGLVVDSLGHPIPGVEVKGNLEGESSGGEIPGTVKTDQSGRYRFRLPVIFTSQLAKGSLSLLFKKEGFASSSSRAIPLTKAPVGAIDVATHTLQPGHPLSFLVVDKRGKPVPGALVYVSGDRIAEWVTLRTDAAGKCLLRDLPPGVAQIHITHGKLHADYPVVISSNDAENTEFPFRFHPAPLPEPSAKVPTPLEISKQAPEWAVSEWSDGKKRTLADFRGKWVVLNFWSMAWNPSIRQIPFCQGVADQKQLTDVVFLSMHTPGGDPVQIKRLQKSTGWKAACAIDQGTTLFDGETAKRYGARNPGTFIIDPEGKIAYNGVYKELPPSEVADRERELKELAASMNIPWPLPHDDSEATQALENRLYCASFASVIEKMMRSK